jgi:hypothetical protein
MPVTQTQAIAYARQLVSVAQQFKSLQLACQQIKFSKNNNAYITALAAMGTAPINADGTLGTKDGSPVITNPIIDPANGTPTYMLPTKTLLANMEAAIDAYLVFLDGSSAPTQVNRNGTIDPIIG